MKPSSFRRIESLTQHALTKPSPRRRFTIGYVWEAMFTESNLSIVYSGTTELAHTTLLHPFQKAILRFASLTFDVRGSGRTIDANRIPSMVQTERRKSMRRRESTQIINTRGTHTS